MSFGWSGQLLRVDLSKRESSTEDTEPYTHSFVGGRGINVKILYDEVDPKVLPFEPENRLCFGPGVLAGTLAPASSRIKVTSMSPNGLIGNSGFGGFVGAEIRLAGYDNIIIQGRADKPVYIYINNDSVEIKDAHHIWGKDTWEAQQIIKGEVGDLAKIMCIGPGGENLVSFGSIITERQSSAARGGMGAIMGSKNLKAIAVRGTKGVKIAKPEEFTVACEQIEKEFTECIGLQTMVADGDLGVIDDFLDSALFFLGNWEEANWGDAEKYRAKKEFIDKYHLHPYRCFGCPVYHASLFNVPGIGIGSADCIGWFSLGPQVWNSDRKVAFHANYLCDRYGLDCCSTGNVIAFLMELYHRGIITEKDTDGIAMKRGDEKAIISAIHKIGKQEGFGKLFQNGVSGAATIIGKGTEDYAMHIKGIEIYPEDLRGNTTSALAAAVATRDEVEDHSDLDNHWRDELKEWSEEWSEKLYGTKEVTNPLSYEKKPLMSWDHGNRLCAADMLGVCRWFSPWYFSLSLEVPAKLFSLATGRGITEDELLFAAQGVKTLERAFNVTKGIRRKDDTLPERFFETAVPDGPLKGNKLDRQKFDKMKDEYYQLRGWDEDGIPTEETFNKLGLSSEWKTFKKRLGKEGVSHG